jgi:hypothetical protein
MEYFDFYDVAVESILDCFGHRDDVGDFIRKKDERKAETLMRNAMRDRGADDKMIDQVIMEIMDLYRSPSYNR